MRPSGSRLVLSWLAVACLATAARAQDLVIARDGTRLLGRLVSCVGDICVVDQQRVPRATIAWLGLGQSGNPPAQRRLEPAAGPPTASAAAATDRLHLTDGSVVEGIVVGISLGTVATEEASYDRPTVAWIHFAGAVDAAVAPVGDLLVLRDGELVHGSLQTCAGDTCRFEARAYSRDDVAWIGLEPDDAAPPVPAGEGDELHLVDGTMVAGRVHGVTATEVMVERGRWPRADVEWIHLAPPADEPPDGGGGGADEVEPPRSDDDDGDGDGDGDGDDDAPPTPREPNRELVKPCPADRPLGGVIEYGHTVADRTYQRCSGSARLWFRLHGVSDLTWPHRLYGSWQSDAITYRLKNDGCTDLPDLHGVVCTAPPQAEIRGRVVLGTPGPAGVMPAAGADFGPVHFAPLTPELSFETLPDEISASPLTPVTCVNPRGGGGSGSWGLPVIGSITARGVSGCSSDCWGARPCVQPTLCTEPTDPEQERDCALHPDRYAVIPFAGSQSEVCDDNGTVTTWSVRWEVCCGCGEPPSGPPPEFDPRELPPADDDPCASLAALRERLGPLNERARETRRDYNEAVRRRDAARDSVWGANGSLAGYFNAIAGFAAEFARGAWGEVTGLASTLYDLVRTPTASGEALIPTPDNFSELQAQLELATNDRAWQPAVREAARAAERTAEAFLAANPNDVAGAQRLYLAELKKATAAIGTRQSGLKALSIGTAVVDYANNTQSLMDGFFGYLEARAEAAEFQSELDEIDAEILGLLEEIERLEEECAAAGGGGSAGASLPTAPARPTAARPALWSGEPGRFALATMARQAHDEAAGQDEVERRLTELRALQTTVEVRLHEGVLPALLPFALGEWRSVDPRLLAGLMLAVGPEVEAVTADLGRVEDAGRELATLLRDLPEPAPGGEAPSAAVGPGAELRPVEPAFAGLASRQAGALPAARRRDGRQGRLAPTR